MACADGWSVIYSIVAEMWSGGMLDVFLPKRPENAPPPPPWPGFDAWLNERPEWLLGNEPVESYLAGFDPDTWGNDVGDFVGWGGVVPGEEPTGP